MFFRAEFQVLGDKIYMRAEDGATKPLLSPNALKFKYLLRGKKIRGEVGPDQRLDEDKDDLREEKDNKVEEKIHLDAEFSQLISLPSVKLSQNLYEDLEARESSIFYERQLLAFSVSLWP